MTTASNREIEQAATPGARAATRPGEQHITARMAAAGSRRIEVEQLLAATPAGAPIEAYRQFIVHENVASKASEVSRLKLLRQLRERYSLDPAAPEFLAFRWAHALASAATERGFVCYLMMAFSDRVFRELSLWIVNTYSEGTQVPFAAVEECLRELLERKKILWSDDTIQHVRQHVLAALKDFGILRGSHTKIRCRILPAPLVAAFAARLAELEGKTPRQTLSADWFKLLGLDEDRAADALRDAHRAGLLSFRRQADVVELKLPSLSGP